MFVSLGSVLKFYRNSLLVLTSIYAFLSSLTSYLLSSRARQNKNSSYLYLRHVCMTFSTIENHKLHDSSLLSFSNSSQSLVYLWLLSSFTFLKTKAHNLINISMIIVETWYFSAQLKRESNQILLYCFIQAKRTDNWLHNTAWSGKTIYSSIILFIIVHISRLHKCLFL